MSAARRITACLHHPATAWVILALSLVVTAIAWLISSRAVHSKAETRFNLQAQEVVAAVGKRMLEYETALRGGAGLFSANGGKVSRASWQRYVSDLHLQQNFPGIQGMGFAQILTPGEIDRHIAAIRAEGYPEYTVRPPGLRSPTSAIVYLEPFDWRNQRAFGYDMYSEPTRRAAMSQAMESGEPTVSGRVTLVQEAEQDIQPGFLMYVPVYRPGLPTSTAAERRAAILGFVYSPFRAHDLMQGILGRDKSEIELEIYDGQTASMDSLLFDSAPGQTLHALAGVPRSGFSSLTSLTTGTRPWTIFVHAPDNFLATEEELLPLLVAGIGIAIDVLLFFVIVSISRRKGEIEREAAKLAQRVSEHESRYGNMFRGAKAPMLMVDPENGRIIDSNLAAQQFYGYSGEEMSALNISQINTLPLAELKATMADACAEKCEHFVFTHRLASGELRKIEAYAGPFRAGGKTLLYSIVHDITERERMATALADSERRYSQVMEATGEGIWDWDITSDTVTHNARWCAILGLDDGMLQHPIAGFVALLHPDDSGQVMAAVNTALCDSRHYFSQHRMCRPNGEIIWVEDHGRVVERDSAGNPTRMVGMPDRHHRSALDRRNPGRRAKQAANPARHGQRRHPCHRSRRPFDRLQRLLRRNARLHPRRNGEADALRLGSPDSRRRIANDP